MSQNWRTKKMTDRTFLGLIGTGVGAVGAGLSVTELQAIISICVTIAGFLISVVAPLIIKLVKWYKKSKEDGKIDANEVDELGQIIDQGGKDIKEGIENLKDKK